MIRGSVASVLAMTVAACSGGENSAVPPATADETRAVADAKAMIPAAEQAPPEAGKAAEVSPAAPGNAAPPPAAPPVKQPAPATPAPKLKPHFSTPLPPATKAE